MNNDDDDRVGYGRPPKHTRFKKGQSGNPRGRRKEAKNLDTLMLQELDEKISVSEGGRQRKMTKRKAIAKRIVSGALKGNPRQLEFLFKYMRDLGIPDPFGMTNEDRGELRAALQAMTSKRQGAAETGDEDGRE